MSLVAAFAVLMAVAFPPPSVMSSPTVPTLTVPYTKSTVPTPTVPIPTKPTIRRRSAAAAIRRRARAVQLGFYTPKPNLATNSFLEVPREIKSQAKDMI